MPPLRLPVNFKYHHFFSSSPVVSASPLLRAGSSAPNCEALNSCRHSVAISSNGVQSVRTLSTSEGSSSKPDLPLTPATKKQKKKEWEINQVFQDEWLALLLWAEAIMGPNGKTTQVSCRVYTEVENCEKLLVPKFDGFPTAHNFVALNQEDCSKGLMLLLFRCYYMLAYVFVHNVVVI